MPCEPTPEEKERYAEEVLRNRHLATARSVLDANVDPRQVTAGKFRGVYLTNMDADLLRKLVVLATQCAPRAYRVLDDAEMDLLVGDPEKPD